MKKIIPLLLLSLLFITPQKLDAEPVPPPLPPLHDDDFRDVRVYPPEIVVNIPLERPQVHLPQPSPKFIEIKPLKALTSRDGFSYDNEVSFYGPGFYGKRTACGLAYTTAILGVAHRTLPCGTLVEFRFKGKILRVPVIDRGPYVDGRQWDLSGALCTALEHCFTGPIEFRMVK